MQKVYGAIFLAAGLAACGDDAPPPKSPETTAVNAVATPTPPPPPVETPPPPKPSLGELIQKNSQAYGEAMMAKDAKKVAATYADNAVVKRYGWPEISGKEAIQADSQKMFDAISDMQGGASRIWAKGDVVIVEWQFKGKHTGEFVGFKGTGKEVGVNGVTVTWFNDDGMRKEEHEYWDLNTLLTQSGAMKGKTRPVPTLSQKPELFESKGGDAEAKNLAAVQTMHGSFEKPKGGDEFVANMTDDVVFDEATMPAASKGKAAAKGWYGFVKQTYTEPKMTTSNAWAFGDFVITETVMTGTHKATKKPVNTHSLDIMWFKDGKVAKGWGYMNNFEEQTQIGKAPVPPKAPAAAKTTPAVAPKAATAAKK